MQSKGCDARRGCDESPEFAIPRKPPSKVWTKKQTKKHKANRLASQTHSIKTSTHIQMEQQIVLVASNSGSAITAWWVPALHMHGCTHPPLFSFTQPQCPHQLFVLFICGLTFKFSRACRDVATGTAIAAYKGNSSPANCASILGRDYIVAAQAGKGSFHFWTWHKVRRCGGRSAAQTPAGVGVARTARLTPAAFPWCCAQDQVHLRSFAPEPITAVACSPDGVYCVAGGASGALHIWDTSSGRLLRSWPAHYKVRPASLHCAQRVHASHVACCHPSSWRSASGRASARAPSPHPPTPPCPPRPRCVPRRV